MFTSNFSTPQYLLSEKRNRQLTRPIWRSGFQPTDHWHPMEVSLRPLFKASKPPMELARCFFHGRVSLENEEVVDAARQGLFSQKKHAKNDGRRISNLRFLFHWPRWWFLLGVVIPCFGHAAMLRIRICVRFCLGPMDDIYPSIRLSRYCGDVIIPWTVSKWLVTPICKPRNAHLEGVPQPYLGDLRSPWLLTTC